VGCFLGKKNGGERELGTEDSGWLANTGGKVMPSKKMRDHCPVRRNIIGTKGIQKQIAVGFVLNWDQVPQTSYKRPS
jgi:hypothetical protein